MSTPFRCPICNGDGYVFDNGNTTSTCLITCHGCNGTGIVWGD